METASALTGAVVLKAHCQLSRCLLRVSQVRKPNDAGDKVSQTIRRVRLTQDGDGSQFLAMELDAGAKAAPARLDQQAS